MNSQLVQETVQNGIIPLQLMYTPVRLSSDSTVYAYRTELQINSLILGVLTPSQYQPVANRTSQCVELALKGFKALCRDINILEENNVEYRWVTAKFPVRSLIKTELDSILKKHFDDFGFEYRNKICIEFSSDILFEDAEKIQNGLTALRALGIKVAVSGFGEQFCPLMRLNGLPFDRAFISSTVSDLFASKNTASVASSTVAFIRSEGIDAILEGLDTSLVTKAYTNDCEGYTMKEEPLAFDKMFGSEVSSD